MLKAEAAIVWASAKKKQSKAKIPCVDAEYMQKLVWAEAEWLVEREGMKTGKERMLGVGWTTTVEINIQ